MAIDIEARRRALGIKQLAHLKSILGKWVAETNGRLKEHKSQILSAYNTLLGVLTLLETSSPPLTSKEFSRLVLATHRIWDHYGSKFAQRGQESNGLFLSEDAGFLKIADQLAYDCYRIAGDHLKKAPPLVTLTGSYQPYVQRRDSGFAIEAGASSESLPPLAATATKHLPFPIIGLPWFQASQPEGLVLVAHEVGHAIEDDLGLSSRLVEAFGCGPEPRAVNWLRWHRELFADVWGCLSVGPAFVYGLAEQMAPLQPWREAVENTGVYPPAWLRIRFDCEVVARMSALGAAFGEDVFKKLDDWTDRFLIHESGTGYLSDLNPILDSLFALDLEATGKLGKDYKFTAEQHKESLKIAAMMSPIGGNNLASFPSDNKEMRVAAAAARIAFEAAPSDDGLKAKKVELLERAVKKGFRAIRDQDAADKARAAGLLLALTQEQS